jgi:leucyl-tRNA synthetase
MFYCSIDCMKNKKLGDYNHLKIEPKWRKIWEKKGVNKTKDNTKAPKFYILDMFPYPSGQGLHVGHPRGFVATDVYSRYKRMHGFNVLHPMGWDAFGLPAENYALKNKTNPVDQTKKNVKIYKEQTSILGFNYDWSREVNTTDPAYYKWTQWIFLQLFKKGLAFESYEPINWCPSCMTGLANEDLEDGKCERCGSVIEKKPMRQWVLKITDYADRLLTDIDDLNWPESIKESQRNWIGRSEGSELWFNIKNSEEKITVFTTRPDTLYGVTYLVLAPENKLVDELKSQIKNWSAVEKYRLEVKAKTEIERTAVDKNKTGLKLNGVEVKHPLTKEIIPVFIADYVLNNYGTGAVMAVPAHDERDYAFAQKYNLPIKEVVIPVRIDKKNPPVMGKKIVERQNVHVVVRNPKDGKILCLQWKKFNWKTFPMGGTDGEDILTAAKREVLEETGYKNLINGKILGGQVRAEYFAAHKDVNRVSYTNLVFFDLKNEERDTVSKEESEQADIFWADLKDLTTEFMTHAEMDIWLQRIDREVTAYTGPGVLINSGKFDGMDNEQAKKEITDLADGKQKVTYKLKDWVFSRQRYWGEPIPLIHCEKCGVVAVPEKDLPVKLPKVKFYEPTGTGESPLAAITNWVNTKCPKCGGKAKRETNTMPQWAGSSWYYLRYIDPQNKKALVDKKKEKYWMKNGVDLYVGGTEHATRHLIYARFWHKFLFDIGVVSTKEPFRQLKNQGMVLGSDSRKMSKRWGNVVNPDEVVKNVGADTLRVYEMFMGPFEQEIAWSTDNMVGSRRFLDKVWRIGQNFIKKQSSPLNGVPNRSEDISRENFETLLHKTIKKVTEDILNFNFNTAISAFMILINMAEKTEIIKSEYEIILKLLAPFAPHMTEEIWFNLNHKKSIHLEKWPEYNIKKIVSDMTMIMVQINGKPRASFEIVKGSTQAEIEKVAFAREDVSKWLVGKEIKKKMFIKERILSLITN